MCSGCSVKGMGRLPQIEVSDHRLPGRSRPAADPHQMGIGPGARAATFLGPSGLCATRGTFPAATAGAGLHHTAHKPRVEHRSSAPRGWTAARLPKGRAADP